MRTKGWRFDRKTVPLLIAGLGLSVACSSNGPTSPGLVPGPGRGPTPTVFTAGPLTAEIGAAMERAILDEYRAEATYSRVLEDFGAVLPFAQVVNAEARHSESIARVYSNHEMTAPADPWHRDNVPRFRSVPEACAAAVAQEERNVAMYDDLLRMELPADVERVFATNRLASLEAHLPAFRICAGG